MINASPISRNEHTYKVAKIINRMLKPENRRLRDLSDDELKRYAALAEAELHD